MTERLTKSAWLKQGLRTLADLGPRALRVGPIAAVLNVSRGSFYWHFRDLADFRSQLLKRWEERLTNEVIRAVEVDHAAEPDRLRSLMRRAFGDPPRLERAIRSWAEEDDQVAARVAAVDSERIRYIAKLLEAAGVEPERATGRATFIYWAYLGQPQAFDPGHFPIPRPVMDDLSDLFEK